MFERIVADREIDISHEVCPMTFVRTRLALDALLPGQVLQVTLAGQEPTRNVPATARQQGHTVLAETVLPNGMVRVLIRRKGVVARQ